MIGLGSDKNYACSASLCLHLAIQTRGWSASSLRSEQEARVEQMEEADMWQMMETNISGGRLRREGREGVGEVRDMIFCPRIFRTRINNQWEE